MPNLRPQFLKPNAAAPSSLPLLMWLGYVFFVVYGSLVPLQYKARPFADALAAFGRIPYLKLGIESRADWVANGVLYVPVGFLTVFLLASVFHRVWRPLLYFVAVVFCTVLALTVEFTQIFFPPRTVSLNDLIAEGIGSLIGITAAAWLGKWFAALLQSFLSDTRRLAVLGLDAYVVAYLAFALFPFDFLLSAKELTAKLASDNWGWLLAGGQPRWSVTLVKLAAEVALTIPFGLLLARMSKRTGSHYTVAAFLGLVLGGLVEVAQFFIASGTSQGLSVATRALGVCAGVALAHYVNRHAGDRTLADFAHPLRRAGYVLALPYLFLLVQLNGWFAGKWQGAEGAQAQLARVNFMPFYYHYYTTEAIALFSLASVFMSYTPVGILAWSMAWRARWALAVAVFLASIVEIGKLFVKGAHPDPTNLLIAGVGAWVAARLLALFARERRQAPAEIAAVRTNHEAHTDTLLGHVSQSRSRTAPSSTGAKVAMVMCTVGVVAWLAAYPTLQLLVAGVLVASSLLVWWRPALAFAIIPVALPIFDLAPWSGRFFFDEFDALVLLVVSVAWARVPRSTRGKSSRHRTEASRPINSDTIGANGTNGAVYLGHQAHSRAGAAPPDRLFSFLIGLLALAFVVALVRGLMPFAAPDLNSFNNYFSQYNALRIFKGALWAWLVWRLALRFVAAGIDLRGRFAWGMTVGLACTAMWIVWERLAFPGLWNFSDGYRVTGSFAATHTGGAYADCFIAAAIPFVIWLTLERKSWLGRIAGLVLAVVSTYALVVTFSRGGYLSFAVAISVTLLAYLLASSGKKVIRTASGLVALGVVMGLVALPALRGDFFQSRLAQVQADWAFRTSHWSDALAIRDPDWVTALLGMGLGRFPDTKYWRSTLHPKTATYQLVSEKRDEADNTFLRLAPGDAIGVEQFVSLKPADKYVLSFDVRANQPNAKVSVYICEKWLLTSAHCQVPSATLEGKTGEWQRIELHVDTNQWPQSPPHTLRPIKLALSHTSGTRAIDFDNLHFGITDEANLLQNGDFSHGLDHWYFSIAGTLHAHWRTHNMFVQTLFDQGGLGIVALIAFLGVAIYRSAAGALKGDLFAASGLAAICGFVIGGWFDTQIDAPRMLMLLLMVAVAPRMHRTTTAQRSHDTPAKSDSLAPKQVG